MTNTQSVGREHARFLFFEYLPVLLVMVIGVCARTSFGQCSTPQTLFPTQGLPLPINRVDRMVVWAPVGNSTDTPHLAVSGTLVVSRNGNNVVGRWFLADFDGDQWTEIQLAGNPEAMCEFQHRLIVKTWYGIKAWDGHEWVDMGDPHVNIGCMYVFDGDLYLGEQVSGTDQPARVLRWTGLSWEQVGGNFGNHSRFYAFTSNSSMGVNCMINFNGVLVAGGSFTTVGGRTAANVARLVDGEWVPMGDLPAVPNASVVFTFAEWNGRLVAGGIFHQSRFMQETIAEWDGAGWKLLAMEPNSMYPFVSHLIGNGNRLLAFGEMSVFFVTSPYYAEWDGFRWSSRSPDVGFGPPEVVVKYGGGIVTVRGDMRIYRDWLQDISTSLTARRGSTVRLRAFETQHGSEQQLSFKWQHFQTDLTDGEGSLGLVSGASTQELEIRNIEPIGWHLFRLVATSECGAVAMTPQIEVTVVECVADYNNSGEVSIQDVFDYLSAWFASAPEADVNSDTRVDIQDLYAFLDAWFAGC